MTTMELLLSYMPAERKSKIENYRYDKDKILSLYSASLIYLGLSEILDRPIRDLHIIRKKNHKPRLDSLYHKEAEMLDFSISHTDNR